MLAIINPNDGAVAPVAGGNTAAYAFPQDPITKHDLGGQAWKHVPKRWGRHGSTVVGGAVKLGLAMTSMVACSVCAVAGAVSMAWTAYDVYKAKGWKSQATAAAGFIPVVGKLGVSARAAQQFSRAAKQRKAHNYRKSRKTHTRAVRWMY